MLKQTPNLANSFNPVPKPAPKNKKAPKPIKKVGKKGKASLDAVEQMKKGFASVGIVECEGRLEGCWHNNALSFAHSAKRRKLTPEELQQAALLCIPCHTIIEVWPAEKMKKFIMDIINKRPIPVPVDL